MSCDVVRVLFTAGGTEKSFKINKIFNLSHGARAARVELLYLF
jgi:hypothetical protein